MSVDVCKAEGIGNVTTSITESLPLLLEWELVKEWG